MDVPPPLQSGQLFRLWMEPPPVPPPTFPSTECRNSTFLIGSCDQPLADLPSGGWASPEEVMATGQELPRLVLSKAGRPAAVTQHHWQEGTRRASNDRAVEVRTRLVDHGCHLWELLEVGYCLQCVCAKSLQSCPTLCDTMDCSPPGSSVHGISQARILEWVAMPFSRGYSPLRDRTRISYISCIGRWVLYH